jgi:DnaJ-class molecular chaperone
VVLGLPRDADVEQIRRAYRRLARRYHPDCGGTDAERFLEVQRAFETLVDREARRRYDRQLSASRRGEGSFARRPAPAVRRRDVRPRSAIEELISGRIPRVPPAGGPGSAPPRDLYAEIVLSPGEAAAGGILPLTLPVRRACPSCGGSGAAGRLACPSCDGTGVREHRDTLAVSVPPGVAPGTSVRLALGDLGLPHVHLSILVSVSR